MSSFSSVKIILSNLRNNKFSLLANLNDPVSNVIDDFAQKLGISEQYIKLIYNQQILDPQKQLIEYINEIDEDSPPIIYYQIVNYVKPPFEKLSTESKNAFLQACLGRKPTISEIGMLSDPRIIHGLSLIYDGSEECKVDGFPLFFTPPTNEFQTIERF